MADYERVKQQKQYEMYRDFLTFFTDHVHFKGNNELTIADFDQIDKTANYLLCTVIHWESFSLHELIDTVSQFPTYADFTIDKNEHGQAELTLHIAWNVVYEEEPQPPRPPQHRPVKRGLQPPPLWQGLVSVFGFLLVLVFALVKKPMLGWP